MAARGRTRPLDTLFTCFARTEIWRILYTLVALDSFSEHTHVSGIISVRVEDDVPRKEESVVIFDCDFPLFIDIGWNECGTMSNPLSVLSSIRSRIQSRLYEHWTNIYTNRFAGPNLRVVSLNCLL